MPHQILQFQIKAEFLRNTTHLLLLVVLFYSFLFLEKSEKLIHFSNFRQDQSFLQSVNNSFYFYLALILEDADPLAHPPHAGAGALALNHPHHQQ